jgi:hypothetical protein
MESAPCIGVRLAIEVALMVLATSPFIRQETPGGW